MHRLVPVCLAVTMLQTSRSSLVLVVGVGGGGGGSGVYVGPFFFPIVSHRTHIW
ncbi:hypothetical protein K435DRAFT_394480 [Dendrothele bispora CBS 962.96]|uniref:Uncharacterized protein n=1 Tax=Dendrothele bispora (strain CBS 962.96) TaxID=1314807 RepID=A0A4S8L903_DENBC|nr:hypothetical protein K435DRAFT_394480 [Dendrothele bispora CBS 962.96]